MPTYKELDIRLRNEFRCKHTYTVVMASRSLKESEPGGVLRMLFLTGVAGLLSTSLQRRCCEILTGKKKEKGGTHRTNRC